MALVKFQQLKIHLYNFTSRHNQNQFQEREPLCWLLTTITMFYAKNISNPIFELSNKGQPIKPDTTVHPESLPMNSPLITEFYNWLNNFQEFCKRHCASNSPGFSQFHGRQKSPQRRNNLLCGILLLCDSRMGSRKYNQFNCELKSFQYSWMAWFNDNTSCKQSSTFT